MTDKSLKHIAIIMDGNGRWAKKRGLPRNSGHKKGAQTVIDIAKAAKEIGVKYLTLYAFSTENWKRSEEEVLGLMNLLREYLDKNFEELKENDVRIVFIGERNMLDSDIVSKMKKLEQETENNKSLFLQVALSYGSRQEIISAVKRAALMAVKQDISVEDINEDMFSKLLYTSSVPDPDLVIRTSGEQRISNYLLWQIAYSEFYFTDKLWPDLEPDDVDKIVENFTARSRRFGGV